METLKRIGRVARLSPVLLLMVVASCNVPYIDEESLGGTPLLELTSPSSYSYSSFGTLDPGRGDTQDTQYVCSDYGRTYDLVFGAAGGPVKWEATYCSPATGNCVSPPLIEGTISP